MGSYDLARERRLAWIVEQGGVCANCGTNDRLEIDHIDRHTKEINPYNIWHRRKEVRDAELAKCQVLCYACHRAKITSEMQEWVGKTDHGRPWNYTKGCRCELCKQAIRDYNNERNARKRAGTFVDKRKK